MVTKQQADKMENAKLTKPQVDMMVSWLNGNLTEQLLDETESWQVCGKAK